MRWIGLTPMSGPASVLLPSPADPSSSVPAVFSAPAVQFRVSAAAPPRRDRLFRCSRPPAFPSPPLPSCHAACPQPVFFLSRGQAAARSSSPLRSVTVRSPRFSTATAPTGCPAFPRPSTRMVWPASSIWFVIRRCRCPCSTSCTPRPAAATLRFWRVSSPRGKGCSPSKRTAPGASWQTSTSAGPAWTMAATSSARTISSSGHQLTPSVRGAVRYVAAPPKATKRMSPIVHLHPRSTNVRFFPMM